MYHHRDWSIVCSTGLYFVEEKRFIYNTSSRCDRGSNLILSRLLKRAADSRLSDCGLRPLELVVALKSWVQEKCVIVEMSPIITGKGRFVVTRRDSFAVFMTGPGFVGRCSRVLHKWRGIFVQPYDSCY